MLHDSQLGQRSFDFSDLYGLTDAQMARHSTCFTKSHGELQVDERRVFERDYFYQSHGLR